MFLLWTIPSRFFLECLIFLFNWSNCFFIRLSFFRSINRFSIGGSMKVPSSILAFSWYGLNFWGGGGGDLVGFHRVGPLWGLRGLFRGGGGGGGGGGGRGGGGGGGGGADRLESNRATIKSISCDFLYFEYPRSSNLLAIDFKVFKFNFSIFI